MRFNKMLKSLLRNFDSVNGENHYIVIKMDTVNAEKAEIIFGKCMNGYECFIMSVSEYEDGITIGTFVKENASYFFLKDDFYNQIMKFILDNEESGSFEHVREAVVIDRGPHVIEKRYGSEIYKNSGLRNMRPYMKFHSQEDGGYGFKNNIQPRVSGKKKSNKGETPSNCKENTQRKAKIG